MKLSGVHRSVCLSVCPSVCHIIRPPHTAAAGLLLSTVPVGDIDRQWRPAAAAPQHGAQQQAADCAQQCHVDM